MPQRPTRGNPGPTPPEVNSAAFQAAVSVAVTATMAQIHQGNNGGVNGQGAGSSNNGINQGPTKTCSYKDFTNAKPRTFNGTRGMITLKRCIKAHKCLQKKDLAFLAHIVDKSKEEVNIRDIPMACKFPDVFPEDLPGIPPERQVEF